MLWLSLNNLYQSIRGKDDYTAADDIISWCQQYAHPYYASEDIEEYRWELIRNREKDAASMGNTLYLGSLKSEIYFCIYEKDYEQYVVNENKVLLLFERIGEILICGIVLIFSDFNLRNMEMWSVF